MNSTLTKSGDHRTFLLVFDPGEDAIDLLADFADKEDIELASLSAIGGFQVTSLGFFNLQTRGFDEIDFHENQVEVLSLTGTITRENGKPHVHIHTVVGRRDGTTRGGHLLKGVVLPILIVTLQELEHHPGTHH